MQFGVKYIITGAELSRGFALVFYEIMKILVGIFGNVQYNRLKGYFETVGFM